MKPKFNFDDWVFWRWGLAQVNNVRRIDNTDEYRYDVTNGAAIHCSQSEFQLHPLDIETLLVCNLFRKAEEHNKNSLGCSQDYKILHERLRSLFDNYCNISELTHREAILDSVKAMIHKKLPLHFQR